MKALFPGPGIGFGGPATPPWGGEVQYRYVSHGLYAIDDEGMPWTLCRDYTLPSDSPAVWLKLDAGLAPVGG